MSWKWLESTKSLQEGVYNYDFEAMLEDHVDARRHGFRSSRLTRFLDWNVTAAQQELAEVREEFSWKPWATDTAYADRERIRSECIDVLHFIGNILVALEVTDEELAVFYQKKQAINTERANSQSYSARKGGLAHGSD